MSRVEITVFGGIRPALSDRLDQRPNSSIAHNLDLKNGNFVPMKKPRVVEPGLTGQTVHVTEDMGYVTPTAGHVYQQKVSMVPFTCPMGDGAIGHVMFCNVNPDPTQCDNTINEEPENCFGPIDPDKACVYNPGPALPYEEVDCYDPVKSRCAVGCLPSAQSIIDSKIEPPPEPYEGPVPPECTPTKPMWVGCDADDGTPAEDLCVCVDNPVTPPTAVMTPDPTFTPGDGQCPEDQTFVYTYVSDLGLETAPSEPVIVTNIPNAGATIDLTLPTTPDGVNCIKVYRYGSTLSADTDGRRGMEIPQFFLVGIYDPDEINISITADMCHDLGDMLCTWEVLPPPPMECVILSDAGHYIGFRNNVLYFSERHEVCNWPLKYQHTLDDRIMGIVTVGEYVYVGTTGKVYVARMAGMINSNDVDYGADAIIQVSATKHHVPLYCKSAMACTPMGAVIPSKEGMYLFSGGEVVSVTTGRICRPEWDEYIPSCLVYSNGFLYGTGNKYSWRLQFSRGPDGYMFGDLTTIDMPATAVKHGAIDGCLWYSDDSLKVWGEGDEYMLARWRSSVLHASSATGFRFAKVKSCFDEPVVFRLYRDKQLHYERVVDSVRPFTLPACPRGFDYYVEIHGCTVIESIVLACSKFEIAASAAGRPVGS